ncbi:DDE-type integrase/transposase/recombinase [Paraburkholderia sp. XV]|uniref:DDE-type integrase/transposase/recombinase n=1 Tax=Paraburkholderia sp. XV TaxID=2831520 RepID=UPI0039903D89
MAGPCGASRRAGHVRGRVRGHDVRPIWCTGTLAPTRRTCCGWADATHIPSGEGFLYLAVVLDVFSRRIVGSAMPNRLYTELILRALDNGRRRLWQRDV